MTDEYAIGHADSFGLITTIGVHTVEYDLNQVQSEEYIRYEIHGPHGVEVEEYEINELNMGDHISLKIAEYASEALSLDVLGFKVPDHLLGSFILNYPEKEIVSE